MALIEDTGGPVAQATSIEHHSEHRFPAPSSSARIGYATEGALFISGQLSTDAVSALRKV